MREKSLKKQMTIPKIEYVKAWDGDGNGQLVFLIGQWMTSLVPGDFFDSCLLVKFASTALVAVVLLTSSGRSGESYLSPAYLDHLDPVLQMSKCLEMIGDQDDR